MTTIINEHIDTEIKRILDNLNIEIIDHGEIPYDALCALKAYLGYKENQINLEIILHIFAYNYIFLSIITEGRDVIDDLSDMTIPSLMQRIEEKDNYLNHLLINYLKIIYYPNLTELISDKYDLAFDLTRLNRNTALKVEFLSDKLSKYLEELYFIYSSTGVNDVIGTILHVLKNGGDTFNTYKKHFSSKNEFLLYRPLIIEMLYLDAYLYLINQKRRGYLNKRSKVLFNEIKDRIEKNDFYTLPSDNETARFLLVSFYYFNIDGEKRNKAVSNIKKGTLKRVHPLLLYRVND